MTIAEVIRKMIDFFEGDVHEICHFLKVWGYAKTIAELEGVDEDTKFTLEAAAVTHDIACPLCRKKYGNAMGKYQEQEGMPLVREFLADSGFGEERIERISYLIGHHHTFTNIDGIDYQILVEADFLVNADESQYSEQKIRNFEERVFRTMSGKRIPSSTELF